jgi:hypothetical protein
MKHAALALLLFACSSTSTTGPAVPDPAASGDDASAPSTVSSPDPGDDDDGGAPDDAAASSASDASTLPTSTQCAPTPPSKCSPKNADSVVRGVARFDPKLVKAAGATPSLWIFLNHRQYTPLGPSEWAQGGHPHAYKSYDTVDFSSGQIPFSIDLCEFETAMWSEDNCDFNLIAMIDVNGNNGPQLSSINMVPDKGEPAKMLTIDISCRAQLPCLDLSLDCSEGQSCVSYTNPGACKCATQSCGTVATCTK